MRTLVFGTVVLTGWIAAPSAQQAPSSPNEPAHKIYMMTGCLDIGSESTSAFRLTRAEPIGQAPPAPSAGTTATSRNTTVYELQPVSNFGEQGISRERLKSHVGKRVEVTVRPVEVTPATTSPSSPPTSTAVAEKPEQPAPQRYTVITISQLADSCQ